jgi:chitosanase
MMTLSAAQKHAVDACLCIFETGQLPLPSAYATCVILNDGAGISYGKHQATDRSSSLDLIVQRYIVNKGTRADELSEYVKYLTGNQTAEYVPGMPYPPWLVALTGLLRAAGADPIMQRAQDEIFDELYFRPALGHANAAGVQHALSLLAIYDTCIQSGPGAVSAMRNRFAEACPANGGDEKAWTTAYVQARKAWLLAAKNPLVQRSVYRPEALLRLIGDGNWDLNLPLTVRGVKVTAPA